MEIFDNKISSIIRVDHAGEYGAKVIYAGQIAALKLQGALKKKDSKKDSKALALIEHMKLQEDEHFDYFDQEIIRQKIRPTLMQPIWKVAGFGLGFLSAMLDKRAAMACTVAVEEVIDEHYQKQISELESIKSELKVEGSDSDKIQNQERLKKTDLLLAKINKFRDQELEHRDIGYDNNATDIAYYQPLTTAIKCFSKLAIFISTKI